MVKHHDLSRAVFVYQHRDTGEIKAFYLDDAHAMTGNEAWHHVGTLEPRAWIESHWRHAMATPALRHALQRLVEYERGIDYHHDRPGVLHEADMALNNAMGDAWPI